MDAPPIQYCRTADGVSIAYWTLGEGPAVIPMDTTVMGHIAFEWDVPAMRRCYEGLAETFQVVRYNGRSSGLSGEGEHSLDGYAADLAAVLDAIGQDRVALLAGGPSMLYAGPFAIRFPHRVGCIVSLGPTHRVSSLAVRVSMPVSQEARQPGETLARLWDPEDSDPQGQFARLINEAHAARRTPPDRLIQLSEALPDELPKIAAPLLVVDWPQRDLPSDGPEFASLIPGARLVTRTGKSLWWFDPDMDSLIDLIREFVLEHTAPQTAASSPATPAPSAAASPAANLSPRELEVLRLIADGKSNPQIAEALVIAPGTVGRHVSNLLAKTGLKNRVELSRYAVQHGLVGD